MDKSVVSILITSLRPKVKQSIVHTIHKFTRQIGLWTRKQGSDQSNKIQQRISRLKEEILIMKNINPDQLLKQALLMNFTEREKILNDVHESLEKKVIVRLATHKYVLDHIQHTREMYPDWSSKLPILLESLGSRRKIKKNVPKEGDKLPNRSEEVIKTKNLSSIALDTISEEMSSSPIKVQSKKKTVKVKTSPLDGANSIEDRCYEEFETSTKNCELQRGKASLEVDSQDFLNTSSANCHAQVCTLSDLLQKENVTNSSKCQADAASIMENVTEERDSIFEEDPFFVTDNNHFLKTKTAKLDVEDSDIDMSKAKSLNMNGNRAERRAAAQGKHSQTQKSNRFSMSKVQSHKNHSRRNNTMPVSLEKEGKMHPSWEAKRQQKFSISSFEGKKVKFDDEAFKPQSSHLQSHRTLHRSTTAQQKVIQEMKLHPSWEAKRKQMAPINVFQGKKIKFEDS